MRPVCLCALLVASAAVAGAQTDANSLTITASRSLAVQPDQLVFAVMVISGLDKGLDDVVAALAGSGIGSENLQTVYTYTDSPNAVTLQWTFTLPVRISETQTAITLLEGLRQTISTKSPGLTLNLSIPRYTRFQSATKLAEMPACRPDIGCADTGAEAR